MPTVVIPQKMSGTGTIRDLANQHYDRDIVFDDGDQYAIVAAAYYGDGNLYWTASSPTEAVNLLEQHADYDPAIMDTEGNLLRKEDLYRRAGLY